MPRRNYSPKSRRVQRAKVLTRRAERTLEALFSLGLTRAPRRYRPAGKGGQS